MLLKRLALLLPLFLVSACAIEEGDDDSDEPVGETEAAITPGPTWKMVTLILPNVDAGYTSGGHVYRARGSMTGEQIQRAKQYAAGVPDWFTKANGGRAAAKMDVIVVPEVLNHLSPANGNAAENGWWPDPTDVAAQLDKYAPKGRYDSVFVVWNPNIGEPDIKFPYGWGRGPGAETNGMTYGSLRFDVGTEGYIHEWLHGAGAFYRSKGFDVPDPHENRPFGHPGPRDDGSWVRWYNDVMRGSTIRAGNVVGYTSPVWRSGTPTHWVGGSYPAPSRPALAVPHIREAVIGGNWVYLEWDPVRRPTHYTQILTIRKPDGSHGKGVSKYEKPGLDRGVVDYAYFTKASVCAAARESGVPLGSVKIGFQLWPDRNVASAANMNVSGSFDCR